MNGDHLFCSLSKVLHQRPQAGSRVHREKGEVAPTLSAKTRTNISTTQYLKTLKDGTPFSRIYAALTEMFPTFLVHQTLFSKLVLFYALL